MRWFGHMREPEDETMHEVSKEEIFIFDGVSQRLAVSY